MGLKALGLYKERFLDGVQGVKRRCGGNKSYIVTSLILIAMLEVGNKAKPSVIKHSTSKNLKTETCCKDKTDAGNIYIFWPIPSFSCTHAVCGHRCVFISILFN